MAEAADRLAPPAAEPPVDLGKVFKSYDIRGYIATQIHRTLAWKVGFATARYLLGLLGGPAARGPRNTGSSSGYDMRPTSEGLARAMVDGIRATGAGAIAIGEVETPALYYAVGSMKALGGIQVTASHQPVEYNGFKICGPGGVPVGMGSGLEVIRDTWPA